MRKRCPASDVAIDTHVRRPADSWPCARASAARSRADASPPRARTAAAQPRKPCASRRCSSAPTATPSRDTHARAEALAARHVRRPAAKRPRSSDRPARSNAPTAADRRAADRQDRKLRHTPDDVNASSTRCLPRSIRTMSTHSCTHSATHRPSSAILFVRATFARSSPILLVTV